MRTTLKNSLLVAILAGLFSLPIVGSGFVEYKEAAVSEPIVLGRSVAVAEKTVNVVYQEDVVVNLSAEETQTIFNVLAEDYAASRYQVLVVVPNVYKENGLTASLENPNGNFNLVINLSNPDLAFEEVPISLLVVTK